MKYGKIDNEIAQKLKTQSTSFLKTAQWKNLRTLAIKIYGQKCMKCGSTPKDPSKTHVDHIKPRKTHPELALVFDNLQILCCRCNKIKGNKDATDYRKKGIENV